MRAAKAIARALCLLLMLLFLAGLFFPNLFFLFLSYAPFLGFLGSDDFLTWNEWFVIGMYVAIGYWALFEYLQGGLAIRRRIFLSVVISDVMMLGADLAASGRLGLRPHLIVSGVVQNIFSYIFVFCVLLGFLADTKWKRNA